MQHFQYIILYYFMKGKNTTEMKKKTYVLYGEAAVTDGMCQSGLQSFFVLLIFWPKNSLLWGCFMH